MIRVGTTVIFAAACAGLAASAAARDVTIPKGTYLELTSASAFDSDQARKGDRFAATVTRGLWVDGQLAIPAGATVDGEIKSVRSSREGARSAALGVKFETLRVGGQAYDIEGVLVSLKADERKRILEQQGKLVTGRHVDVVLIGGGTEADMKADTLVGISGADRDDLADEWAKSGLGPATVQVRPGTTMTMQLDKTVSVAAMNGPRAAGDRRIFTGSDTVKSLQRALKGRNYYTGEAAAAWTRPRATPWPASSSTRARWRRGTPTRPPCRRSG